MSVTLRPRVAADLPELWRWMHATPGAEWKRWEGPYFHDEPEAISLIEYTAKAESRPPNPDVRIIEIGGLARGTVTRHWEAPQPGGWLDVIYDPACWSGGHGTQALRLWTGASFRETPAHVITLTTWGGKARMIAAGSRVGYSECARIWEARLWQIVRYDSVKLDLLRAEWELHQND